MDDLTDYYFGTLTAAFVRGQTKLDLQLLNELTTAVLSTLTTSQINQIIQAGLDGGLRLHRFKRTMGLARVQRVLGYLKGIQPTDLLDIGSGRGAFLWPLLDAFPGLRVTAVDQNPTHIQQINAVHQGGIRNVIGECRDIIQLPYADNQFDVITVLEVLEHIPQVAQAVNEIVRVGRRFVIASVPSKEDNNPEHIHLFDQQRLGQLFTQAGVTQLKFSYVLNHMILVANLGK